MPKAKIWLPLVVLVYLLGYLLEPAFAVERFTFNSDGTVTDTKSGLMWEQQPHDVGLGTINWHQAITYCKELNLAGHTDWRLPTLAELESLYDKNLAPPRLPKNTPFDLIEDYWFWSSTIYSGNNTDTYPYVVYPSIGYKITNYDKTFAGNVLAVRNAR